MATKIVTKNSSTASAVPTASDLVQGELAVNVADKRLFTEDNGGAIVELGTNPSTIDINAGSIDGATIGASSASTGAFTTLTATGSFTSLGIDDNATSTAITIDSSENVGIGTSSPDANLVVYETATSGTDHFAQRWRTQSGGVLSIACSDLSLANPTWQIRSGSSEPIAFNQASNERMRIGASGNVSIGTSATSAPLRVNVGTDQNCAINTSGGNPRISAFNDAVTASVPLGFNGSILKFETGGSERMRIDASGNVGIGTSSPNALIDLGTSTGQKLLMYANSNIKYGMSIESSEYRMFSEDQAVLTFGHMARTDGTTYTERMRIDSSGNVLVGTTTSLGRITVTATGSTTIDCARTETSLANQMIFRNGNGAVGSIQTTGSSTSYNTSSDYRLKENIADADDAGSKIDSIQVRQYDWKADGSHQDYGMIAQELVEVAPEAVTVPADSEDMMGVDYSKLVPMLIKEIQSLRNRVAQLEE